MEPLFWPRVDPIPIRNLRRRLQYGQVFWREVGQPQGLQTVIFLHGSWHDGDQWGTVLALMGAHHHCLAPDLIGFGESEHPQDASTYSIAMQVDVLAELLASLRLSSVILVGHSLGAWVAASYALRYPEQVQGLCILEPEGLVYEPQRWRRERWLVSLLGGLWLTITKPFARKRGSGRAPTWFHNLYLRQRLKRNPAACRLLFQRRRNALEPEILGPQLASLSMPVMAIQGDSAGEASYRLTKTLTTLAPEARVTVLSGYEELPSYEAEAIADVLTHWVSELPVQKPDFSKKPGF